MNKIMQLALTLLTLLPLSTYADEYNALMDKLNICQKERSPLFRLDCYDAIFAHKNNDGDTTTINPVPLRSKSAQLALEQEITRTTPTVDFLVSSSSGDNPTILLTTPAIGTKPPRPILAFSCIDNITRMQILFATPLKSQDSRVTLKTEHTQFNSTWFIRDQGHTLEASRGLPGIQEIQKLFNTGTLTFVSQNKEINGLSFTISDLSQTIKPLRTACRW